MTYTILPMLYLKITIILLSKYYNPKVLGKKGQPRNISWRDIIAWIAILNFLCVLEHKNDILLISVDCSDLKSSNIEYHFFAILFWFTNFWDDITSPYLNMSTSLHYCVILQMIWNRLAFLKCIDPYKCQQTMYIFCFVGNTILDSMQRQTYHCSNRRCYIFRCSILNFFRFLL